MLRVADTTLGSSAYVVSFKLETDETLVIEKAQKAIREYHVHLVVANQLQTGGI